MKRPLFFFFAVLLASSVNGQVVKSFDRGIAVAHDAQLSLYDISGKVLLWTVPGLQQPARIIAGADRLAVIDPMADEALLVDSATGKGGIARTGSTPVDGAFIGRNLFLLERDARAVERIGADGTTASIAVAGDPAFLREAGGRLFVYSRLDGIVQEISVQSMSITRTLKVAPFASDFEIDGRYGYLVYPREAQVRTFTLATMKSAGEFGAGAVPVDMAVARGANALGAAQLAIADPAAKRVWRVEGSESLTAAVARGFIRGLLGLGLFAPASSQFPTGVDRVVAHGSTLLAFDSTTGTLYRIRRGKASVLTQNVPSAAFSAGDRGVAVWQERGLHVFP